MPFYYRFCTRQQGRSADLRKQLPNFYAFLNLTDAGKLLSLHGVWENILLISSFELKGEFGLLVCLFYLKIKIGWIGKNLDEIYLLGAIIGSSWGLRRWAAPGFPLQSFTCVAG